MTYNKNQPESIQKMFGSIAKQYDRTNALLSFQMHRWWNKQLVKAVLRNGEGALADLCCGTGEIASVYLKQCKQPVEAYLVDFCQEMLDCAKTKSLEGGKHRIRYYTADVQKLPLGDKSVSACTVAYGIRNVKEPLKCIEEMHRVLKEGGCAAILELTRPKNSLLRMGHRMYLKAILPVLGKMATSNKEAYQYLCRSIENFSEPAKLREMMLQTGFKSVEVIPLTGGVATIVVGKK